MRFMSEGLAATIGIFLLVLASQAHADEAPDLKRDLADSGIDLGLSLTEFAQSAAVGDGDSEWKIGGKIDATLGLDLNRLGLWPGLTVSIHHERVYGDDVNDQGDGSLLPVNVAMGFPRLGGRDAETAVVFTQSFNDKTSVSLGKFNMLDAAARTPLMGGGGINTFSHVGLAAPISGVTPPYLLGAMGTLRTDNLITTVMIYDPRNAQDPEVLEAPFEDGVTVSLSATRPVTFLGDKPGFQGLRAVYSSQRGLDLNDIPQLTLPPEADAVIGEKSGYWYLAYSFQQYLSYDAGKGWGIYGQAAISDGNPNTVESSILAGLGGSSPLASRTDDQWGLGYFRYNLSSRLLDGLQAVGINNLRHEQGLEAFYNLQLLKNLRLTASLNYIAPGNSDRDDALFTGLRLQARF